MAGMMPTPASDTSPTAYTILDVDQNAYLFVGGIFGTVKVSVCVQHHPAPVFDSVFVLIMLFFFYLQLLESRCCKNNNIHRLYGRDFPGW